MVGALKETSSLARALLLLALAAGCSTAVQSKNDGGKHVDMSLPVDFSVSRFAATCEVDAGERWCGDICVGPGACCTASDCPKPASGTATCVDNVCGVQCDASSRRCGDTCIALPDGSLSQICCSNVDCDVFGQSCSGVGGTCNCPPNKMVCKAGTACIAAGSCCSVADCPPTMNATTIACPSPMPVAPCTITGCVPGFVDVDQQYLNGCECATDGAGASCGGATPVAVSVGGAAYTHTAALAAAGQEAWFNVTASGNTNAAFHPQVQLTNTGGGAYVIDVFANACPTAGGAETCNLDGTSATSVTSWDTAYAAPGGFSGTTTPHGEANTNFQPIGQPNILVRVRKIAPATLTCTSYTISISC
jgi:hypothetical protein